MITPVCEANKTTLDQVPGKFEKVESNYLCPDIIDTRSPHSLLLAWKNIQNGHRDLLASRYQAAK